MRGPKFYRISNFLKNVCGSFNFKNLSLCSKNAYKYNTSITNLWYWIWPKSIEGLTFFEILNFLNFFWDFEFLLRFWIFWKFSLNRETFPNFELLSSKFVYECTNTKWCFIRNLKRIGREFWSGFFFAIFANLSNSSKFRFIELKFCA